MLLVNRWYDNVLGTVPRHKYRLLSSSTNQTDPSAKPWRGDLSINLILSRFQIKSAPSAPPHRAEHASQKPINIDFWTSTGRYVGEDVADVSGKQILIEP